MQIILIKGKGLVLLCVMLRMESMFVVYRCAYFDLSTSNNYGCFFFEHP